MRLIDAVGLSVNACKWYMLPDKSAQYEDGPLLVYDNAARVLTQRELLGRWLATFIGSSTDMILEVAAGTGLVSQALIDCGTMFYSDISLESLNILQKRVASNPTLAASFFKLPFTEDAFQTIVNVGGYRYVLDEEKYWLEMSRVLKKGGKTIIVQFYPRVAEIQGKDISKATNYQINFRLSQTSVLPVHVSIRGVKVQSGHYRLYEFTKV